jgi:hypothetical protein
MFTIQATYFVSSFHQRFFTSHQIFSKPTTLFGGTRWLSWLRKSATSLKVVFSILYGVTGILHWRNPSGRTVVLGSTQPVTEMCTRNISLEVMAAGALGWQPYHLHVPIVLKSGNLKLQEHQGLSRPVMGLLFLFYCFISSLNFG